MASKINADNGSVSGTAGITTSSDGTGILQLQTNGVTGIEIDTARNVSMPGTGALTLPKGTTAQRPASPVHGMTRLNTTVGSIEIYDGTAWQNAVLIPYVVEVLAVAGGGGGGFQVGGGGGAGGLLYLSSQTLLPTNTLTISIGAGGAGAPNSTTNSINGSNTTITGAVTLTAIGGGKGASHEVAYSTPGSGGSGGGGSGNANFTNVAGGAGTAGQGFAGGTGLASNWAGGGGGGATQAGQNGQPGGGSNQGVGGYGGAGAYYSQFDAYGTNASNSITPTSGKGYFAGGGGGCSSSNQLPGAGGVGGGGRGFGDNGNSVYGNGTTGEDGKANTGGGGGGVRDVTGSGSAYSRSGNGASGILLIRYPGSQRGTGGTVTTANGYTTHAFTTSGTYTA